MANGQMHSKLYLMDSANATLANIPPQEIQAGPEGGCQICYLNNNKFIVTGWARNLEAAVQHARWGTYGKHGNEPLSWPLLRECSTEHLEEILNTQRHVYYTWNGSYERIIKAILQRRKQD